MTRWVPRIVARDGVPVEIVYDRLSDPSPHEFRPWPGSVLCRVCSDVQGRPWHDAPAGPLSEET